MTEVPVFHIPIGRTRRQDGEIVASVHGCGGDSMRHRVCRGGVVGVAIGPVRLRWSCETSTLVERGSDDRGEIGAVRADGEGR